MRELSQHRLDAISRTIETEVIPRLVLARRAAARGEADSSHAAPSRAMAAESLASWQPDPENVASLTRLALARDEQAAGRYIDDLTTRGAPVETICGGLLGPAARALGAMWDDDRVSFTEVTTGVWRLQQILRSLAPGLNPTATDSHSIRQILLVPAVGEQHSFGISMVAVHFRTRGWVVRTEQASATGDLVELVRDDWFDVIGFSVGSSDRLAELTACIRDIRRVSRNARIGVMVGGPVFLAHPNLVAQVGADATAADGAEAADKAAQLLDAMDPAG